MQLSASGMGGDGQIALLPYHMTSSASLVLVLCCVIFTHCHW